MLTNRRLLSLLLLFLVMPFAIQSAGAAPSGARSRIVLHEGWQLQSSRLVTEKGEVVSTVKFQPTGWIKASAPSTVLAAQVAAGIFPDPYFAMNLRQIPGTTYPIGDNYSNLPMPQDSPYACSWWYRTEFLVPPSFQGSHIWLHFGGINYRANIWLNGKKLAGSDQVAGAYRIYDLDATGLMSPGRLNVLAVETFAPTPDDLGINWVDWNPTPPDKDMGIWGDVYLTESGPVSVRRSLVTTHFPDASLAQADLTVTTQVHNATDHAEKVEVEGRIESVSFKQTVTLSPGETRPVTFTPGDFPQLQIKHPRIWWPAAMGQPALHYLSMRVSSGGATSDTDRIRFGIREITTEFLEHPNASGEGFADGETAQSGKNSLLFRVNGRRILIRGGGWSQDMLLRRSRQRLETQLQYLLDMNLNTIRLEGKLDSDEFFDLADEKGVLVMAGWCCCDHWEKWNEWKPTDLEVASESLRAQILRLRSHPSLLVWLNGSDGPPPPNVEQAYISVLKESAWPNPYISSASAATTTVTGQSGVKMTGPYDYVPPCYWTVDPGGFGGAWGFNTETSPGPAVPTKGSLEKMLPKDHLWPMDEVWKYHAGSEGFKDLSDFNRAMDAMYGPPTGLDDYLAKSQAMSYDGERAMFEAYSRNKYNSTGVIQWMLNNAWPSLIWHLYDYYLQPAGGYFGTKKACEPLHVLYSYNDRSVVVVNSLYRKIYGLSVSATLYDFGLHKQFSRVENVVAEPDASLAVFTIPAMPSNQPQVYFLKLELRDGQGKIVSTNFYWLSNKGDAFDWKKTTYRLTPVTSFEDMTMLSGLPRVRLDSSAEGVPDKAGDVVQVRLHNPSAHLAFQVHVGISEGLRDDEILPVLWDDNYLELMPGETRIIKARYPSAGSLGRHPELVVDGWNIIPTRSGVKGSASTKPSK
jgi:exo-1,4-beta-D-glucosaminidase